MKTVKQKTVFSAKCTGFSKGEGHKVSMELDTAELHSGEVFEAFKVLFLGLSFTEYTWKNQIMELADQYKTEDKK